MRYVVISPDGTIICFNSASEAGNFCMMVENKNLDRYAGENGLNYEVMTPVEIGFAYDAVGTEDEGAKVYDAEEILKVMSENQVDNAIIKGTRDLFELDYRAPILYPTFLDDIFAEVTPMAKSSFTGNLYTLQNIGN